jgi:hypothetical protein
VHGDPGEVIRKRRAIAVGVVLAAASIAACLGPSLSTTEQPAVVVQQGTNVDIGDVNVGSTGTVKITISPASGSGSSSDKVTAISENCPAFSLVVPPLPYDVNRTCTGSGSMGTAFTSNGTEICTDTNLDFEVNFTPTAAGKASCTVTISGSTFSPITVLVSGTGVAPTNGIDVTPPGLNFGDIRIGDSGSGAVQIRNTGTNMLDVNDISIAPNGSAYSIDAFPPFSIPPGGIQDVNITCTPPLGPVDATLTVASSAGSRNVSLFCAGITTDLVLAPSPVEVTVRVGETADRFVTVENLGSASAQIDGYAIAEANGMPITIVSPPTFPFTIGPGSQATVQVRHAPTAPTPMQSSTQLAKLRVTHDGSMMREIPINGAALETAMQVFPDTVDFGPVCAGTSETRDVEIKAAAAGSFELSSATPPTAPFTFVEKEGTVLPAIAMGNQANQLDFVATVSPAASASPGPIESKVVLVSDIPNDTMHDVVIKAEVLPGGVGASPQAVDFGGIVMDTVSQAMKTAVRNCSDAPLAITDVHIEGPNLTDFSIVIPGPADQLRTLQPQEVVEYHIVMRAETPGAKVATLVVASASSATNVQLLGTALGGDDGEDGGSRSYYTGWCAAGRGDASYGVLVLAVGFLLRRRRRA